jgi:uncharacterized repeat protein (TIGR03803 family)
MGLEKALSWQRRNCWRALRLLFALLAPLFSEAAEAQTLTVLYSFGPSAINGDRPGAGVIRDSKGNLYGTTDTGGTHAYGTVFKVTPAGKETVLYNFTGGTDGYGPNAALVRDTAGNLYGTTFSTAFKLDPTGKLTVLHTFTGTPDGAFPSGLIRDSAGNLYGSAVQGGTYNAGIVYKLSPTGVETILHNFTGTGSDQGGPFPILARDSAGNLYGTTGGQVNVGLYGTVFKVDSSGNETTLYTFTGGADGGSPSGGVIRDKAGNLYGATALGGSAFGTSGIGVIFKLDTNNKQTVLYTFAGSDPFPNGAYPTGSLVRDSAGNLYGATAKGGAYNFGAVFKLDTSNNETVLYSFSGGNTGTNPAVNGGLALDSAGNLYGTTGSGGRYLLGDVFKLKP